MPINGKPPSPCRFFWLRYAASLLMAGGACFCAVRGLDRPPGHPQMTAVAGQHSGSALPTTAAPAPPEIVIDPGHGGNDPGTSAHGQEEKTWTLTVGRALAKELRARGWPVELTRDSDTTVPLPERSIFANQKPRLAFVSLHFNSGGPEATGIESYYAWPRQPEALARLNTLCETPDGQNLIDDRSRLLAEALQTAVCAATGAKNRGIRNDPALSVTSRTVCPAALVELGFLTSATESRTIQSEAYREKMVRGLADALESWLREAAAPGYGIRFEPAAPAEPVTAARQPGKGS